MSLTGGGTDSGEVGKTSESERRWRPCSGQDPFGFKVTQERVSVGVERETRTSGPRFRNYRVKTINPKEEQNPWATDKTHYLGPTFGDRMGSPTGVQQLVWGPVQGSHGTGSLGRWTYSPGGFSRTSGPRGLHEPWDHFHSVDRVVESNRSSRPIQLPSNSGRRY